ncbi:YesL family protein [Neobacillus niacini]|uniref:YesL family protein n=1 Tax=Neobacillus niacini TaxID=86668 RepID=UPI001C8DC9CE|nr:DUF624 domain-containing protein [Neobacillus niacini]MBY0144366.1 DUF624 domain-containing protein [Neobacillus niacini]
MGGSIGGVLKIPVILLNLAYLNLLWVLFSILGLVFFGFFPATTSMFAVIRKWVMGDLEIPIFKTFWSHYKKYFLKSNLLGLVITLVGFFLVFDIRLVQQFHSGHMLFFYYFLLMIALILGLTVLYVLPVFVHFELSIYKIIKTSFSFMIVSPLSTIMMFAGGIIIFFILKSLPGLVFIIGGSLTSLLIMWSSYHAFSRLNQKNISERNFQSPY